MPVKYNYEGWAPWNDHLSADRLQVEILKLYKEKYGDDFMEVRHPKRGTAYIKVDGNRRITLSKADERHVYAVLQTSWLKMNSKIFKIWKLIRTCKKVKK